MGADDEERRELAGTLATFALNARVEFKISPSDTDTRFFDVQCAYL